MFLNDIRLVNFRNYKDIQLQFGQHTNIFVGDNAQGKTNLVEAIYFLSLLKSFRSQSIKDLFFFNTDYFTIQGNFQTSKQSHHSLVNFLGNSRTIKLDSIEIKKTHEYIGLLNVISFTPDDLNIIKGYPSERRKIIDIELSKISPIYLYELSKYHYLLKQRNKLLKKGIHSNDLVLDVLTNQMIDLQISIYKRRRIFLDRLLVKVKEVYYQIANNQDECLIFEYKSFIDKTGLDFKSIKDLYQSASIRESVLKSTLYGIHKDDIVFYLNDKRADDFASQGQQRSIVLSLKIGLLNLVFDEIGEYPILLLDDVLSELDDHRRNQLLHLLNSNIQVFITTTSIDGIDFSQLSDVNIFNIDKGNVLKEDANGREE